MIRRFWILYMISTEGNKGNTSNLLMCAYMAMDCWALRFLYQNKANPPPPLSGPPNMGEDKGKIGLSIVLMTLETNVHLSFGEMLLQTSGVQNTFMSRKRGWVMCVFSRLLLVG